jgi:hypothetical protein
VPTGGDPAGEVPDPVQHSGSEAENNGHTPPYRRRLAG